MSLARLQEVPVGKTVLLVGSPGAGKSTFCQQAVLQNLAMDRPIIYVTTEYGPSEAEKVLRERGLGGIELGLLNFIDAYNETVGLSVSDRPDTVPADCGNLSSISIAISKLQNRLGKKGILLIFDSLTSPYLLSGPQVVRFMRLTLSKFAGEGNSVLVCFDEGSGKEEDLIAMMSLADGIIRLELKEKLRIINVVKHPTVTPTKIETKVTRRFREGFERGVSKHYEVSFAERDREPLRTEVGDFVNMIWRNLASWSGMLWDPKRFPTMAYELDKEAEYRGAEHMLSVLPWRKKFLLKWFMPKSFNKVKDMKKLTSSFLKMGEEMRIGILDYVEEASKKDEHYIMLHESSSCWGFENVGARLAFHDCGEWAGFLSGVEKEKRDWNVIETKCIGMGSSYCEFKAVPGEIDELKNALEAINSLIVEKIHDRLMDQVTGFLIHGKPLTERPKLGSGVSFHEMHHVTGLPASYSERYQMALRMGGAKMGKEVGQRLMDGGLKEDEAIRRVIDFMNYCKVGKTTLGETVRIKENCENFGIKADEPSCFFTTGFLSGLFSTIKNWHVRETKCIAMGDLYCEWKFR